MHRQTHFLEENPLQHQMTHEKNYSTGVWGITPNLGILTASNDTYIDKSKIIQ